jgi:hypothetical protein
MWNVITVSLRQAIVPDHLVGRLNSSYRLLAWGMMPAGAAIAGLGAEVMGARGVSPCSPPRRFCYSCQSSRSPMPGSRQPKRSPALVKPVGA